MTQLPVSAAELLRQRARCLLDDWMASGRRDGDAASGLPSPDEAMAIASVEHRLSGPEGHPWTRIVDLFTLADVEADLLAMALAVAGSNRRWGR